jgi:nitroreductase
MELEEAIKGRRSIRAFKSQHVPEGTVEKLIDAARLAPSAGNSQSWEFIILRNIETKKKTCKSCFQSSLR